MVDPFLRVAQHGPFVAVIPQMREALRKKIDFENAPVQSEQGVQLTPLAAIQIEPTVKNNQRFPRTRNRGSLRETPKMFGGVQILFLR
jgi:hypothetical protein